jgi:hypothetical protein
MMQDFTPKEFMIVVRHAQRADDPSLPHDLRTKQSEILLDCDP